MPVIAADRRACPRGRAWPGRRLRHRGGRDSASTFALTEARIGVAPSIISLTLLPKMTARAAGRYFLTGEKFGAAEAADIGLITIAADDVEATVSPADRRDRQGVAAGPGRVESVDHRADPGGVRRARRRADQTVGASCSSPKRRAKA